MSDVVIDDDVNEAIRLVEKSRDSIKPGKLINIIKSFKTFNLNQLQDPPHTNTEVLTSRIKSQKL